MIFEAILGTKLYCLIHHPECLVGKGEYTYFPVGIPQNTTKKKEITIKNKKSNIFRTEIGTTLNVRTLRKLENFTEVEKAFMQSKLAILGLSEIRRGGEKIQITRKGNLFQYIGSNGGQKGVGFLVKSNLKKQFKEIKGISDRITSIKIKINKTIIICIQVYATTTSADEEEIEKFYELVEEVMVKELKIKNNKTFLLGDWNSQIGQGQKGEYDTVGRDAIP